MANGKIKGKQIEDLTLDLDKLSGNGSVIIGTGSTFQIVGTAVNPNDIVSLKDLASVGGKLTISDYNTGASFSNIENIIFRGQNVLVPGPTGTTATGVNVQGGGPNIVTVWIPSATYADYFNTDTNVITPETTTSRFIAAPTTEGNPYYIGDWAAGSAQGVLDEPSSGQVSYTCTNFSVLDLTTTLDFTIFDGTGATLSTQSMTVATNSVSSGGLTTNVTAFSADEDRYKATVTFTADLNDAALIGDGGRFSVEMVHNNSTDGTYTFNQNNIFYDSDGSSSNATIGSVTIEENVPNLVWRSGIAYYSDNSSFTFSVLNIDNINDKSYPRGTTTTAWNNDSTANQIRLTPLQFNMGTSYGHSSDFTGWDNTYNVSDLDWIFVDSINSNSVYIPDLNGSNDIDTTVNTLIRANIYDWIQEANNNSANFKALIDTYSYTNNNTTDSVGDEGKRLDFTGSEPTASWDTNVTLPADALQVAFDKIIYPRDNYSTYHPDINITNTRDYSSPSAGPLKTFDVYTQVTVNDTTTSVGLTGYRWYATEFLLSSVSNTGTLTFTSNMVESDFEIENGNNTLSGDDDVAILVGHDSGSPGAGTTPDKYIYVTGDYSGRTATLTNTFGGTPKKLSFTWGTVGNYSKIWVLIGIKSTKENRYISQISIASGI